MTAIPFDKIEKAAAALLARDEGLAQDEAELLLGELIETVRLDYLITARTVLEAVSDD